MEEAHRHNRRGGRQKKARRVNYILDSDDDDYVDGDSDFEDTRRRRPPKKAKKRPRSKAKTTVASRKSPPQIDDTTTTAVTSTTSTTTSVARKQGRQYDERLFRLFLGLNDKFRVPTGAWDFLAFKDLITCAAVSKQIREELIDNVEYTRCRDGKDYLVRFPAFPGLLSTKQDLDVSAGLFPHQLASLQAMQKLENTNTAFGSLRGGILGDAPGLGKTITMLALISSTSGQRPVTPPEFWDAKGVAEGWSHMRVNPAARKEILTATRPIRSWVQSYLRFGSAERTVFQELVREISPPFLDGRFPTLRDLELHVYRKLRGVGFPLAELELFRTNMMEVKAGMDKRNRKLLKGPAGQRILQERKLIPSSATLIIVPDALLEHWFQQIHSHLDLSRFVDYKHNNHLDSSNEIRNLVYIDGIGDFVDATLPLNQTKATLRVPPAYMLSQYFIVITTFSRCKSEGNQTGSRQRRQKNSPITNYSSTTTADDSSNNRSTFSKIRWLRLVVDEGHELGIHETATSLTEFIHEIAAERRWVLSGTPTTGDQDDIDFSSRALDQLQRLLAFLRHPTYGNIPSAESSSIFEDDEEDVANKDEAKDEWLAKVKTPFLAKLDHGCVELQRVLTECLVIHRKEDLKLPQPIFLQGEMDVPIPEDVQVKIRESPLTSKWILQEYLYTDAYQSLVDEAQARFIVNKLRKARADLKERGGALRDAAATQGVADYEHLNLGEDRRPIKAVVYSHRRNDLQDVTEYCYKYLGQENIAELYDPAAVSSMGSEMSRFRNDFKEMRICPICQRGNNVGENSCSNTLVEVIGETDSGSVRFLVEPERIIRALSPGEGGNVSVERLRGEPLSSYNKSSRFWRTGDFLEVDCRDEHPMHPKRWSDEVWLDYGVDKCFALARENNYQGHHWYFGPLPSMQPQQTTMTVRLAKFQHCSRFHQNWYKGPRFVDAPIQREDEDVFLLALDAEMSHGLDLSFVTHMFLLEPIEDAALLEQVTSRAHRLGARGPVQVETVNVFYTLDEATEKVLEGTDALSKSARLDQKLKTLTKVCCQHCFRQFDSHELAVRHETTNCPRNRDIESTTDPFQLSSVYRAIKPPPAVRAKEAISGITK